MTTIREKGAGGSSGLLVLRIQKADWNVANSAIHPKDESECGGSVRRREGRVNEFVKIYEGKQHPHTLRIQSGEPIVSCAFTIQQRMAVDLH